MAIEIKKPAATHQGDPSAHAEAAAAIETETAQTTTKLEGDQQKILDQQHDSSSEPVQMAATPFERIDVGTEFKMPVADYTMLTFSVRRSVPYDPLHTDPDKVFADTKAWVEEKMNQMIAEQQGG